MKINYYSRIAALAAIVVGVGCAGNGTAHIPSGSLNFSGAETVAATSTADATVPATGGTTTTTSAGSAVIPSGSVPPGTVLPAGSPFAILPSGTGFIGSTGSGSQVSVNGVSDSGATIGPSDLLSVNVALPVSAGAAGSLYDLSMPAANLNTSRSLHVGSIVFSGRFYISSLTPLKIISPVPKKLAGVLPNDGENASGSYIKATWGPGNSGRSATLFIDYGNGFTLHQTKTIDGSGNANFTNFVPDASNIPSTGIAVLSFTIGNL